jgi:protein phosphatase
MLRVAEAVHRTDTGRQRNANEDSLFSRAPVFAVADGMGGAQAGEVASRLAVEVFEPEPGDGVGPEAYLRGTVQQANRLIFDHAQGDASRSGMGTTLTAAIVSGEEVSFGHVGDSRAYLYREGELSQLTNDHSLVEELRRQGKLTRDQAAEHPQRSVITRALGPEPQVAVDTMTVRGRPGDVYVLCSDGLTTMVSDEELTSILAQSEDLDGAARGLVRAANEHGGRDNITVVLFRLEDADAAAGAPAEGVTLVGAAAEQAGLTADAVSEGARDAGIGPSPPEPARAAGRWRSRLLKLALVVLVVLALGSAAYYGARQVWFLGADEVGRVTLYRGLPYELPFGVDLYSSVYTAPVTVGALPADRRDSATNHELRSRADAVSLIEDLQRAAEEAAAARRAEAAAGQGKGKGKGGKAQGGGGGKANGKSGSGGGGGGG